MAYPSGTLATLRPDLAAGLEAYDIANKLGFIALDVLPELTVLSQAGTFGKLTMAELLKEVEVDRAPGAGYSRDTEKFSPDTYVTTERGTEELVDRRDAARFANYFDAELIAGKRAYRKIWTAQEKRVAAAVFNTSTWTGATLTTAVTVPWTTVATAIPIDDIAAAKEKVMASSGQVANTLIINWVIAERLRRNTSIREILKYNGIVDVRPSKIQGPELAMALGIEKVLVAGQTRLTSKEGATAAFSQIWPQTMAMVCVTADAGEPDVAEPCIGRTFHWREDGSEIDGTIETYYEEPRRSDVVRVRHDVQEKILLPETGHLLTNIG